MNIEIPAELIEAQREHEHWTSVSKQASATLAEAEDKLELARKRLYQARCDFTEQVNKRVQELARPAEEG